VTGKVLPKACIQSYQVSRISRETPTFWSHLLLTCCITKISRIFSTKFGQLILNELVKIVATRCHILRLKCSKFDFSWVRDPAGGAQVQYSPRPSSWILGVLLIREGVSVGRKGKAGGKGEPGAGKERREGEWRGYVSRMVVS